MGLEEMHRVLELFKERGIEYRLYEHEPVYTSIEASKVRGVELKTGVKALVLKQDRGGFLLADIAADRRIDFKKLQSLVQGGKIHFASKEEVISLTHCEPGSVHPIGELFGLPTYLDRSVEESEYVNFNIGLLTRSVKIRKDDLFKILLPKAIIASFTLT